MMIVDHSTSMSDIDTSMFENLSRKWRDVSYNHSDGTVDAVSGMLSDPAASGLFDVDCSESVTIEVRKPTILLLLLYHPTHILIVPVLLDAAEDRSCARRATSSTRLITQYQQSVGPLAGCAIKPPAWQGKTTLSSP